MVSSVGYGAASSPSTQRASVSGEASAQAAQSQAVSAADATQNNAKQDPATKPAQPGVTVSISPEGAAAASRAQRVESVAQTDDGASASSASANAGSGSADSAADVDGDTATADTSATSATTDSAEGSTSGVSPVKAFAYGALGLERPDQPQDERNAFYTAGKWLAAGLTIGGLISLLA